MRIGRIRKGGKILSVAFKGEDAYSLAAILDTEEDIINHDFYDIILSHGDSIEEALKEGNSRLAGKWNYEIPIPAVNQIRDFYAFEEHVKAGRKSRGLEMIPEWYEFPVFYYSGTSNLYASGAEVEYPRYTNQLDFELEVGVVIGKEGRDIRAGDAMDHIFGAMFLNDWSARDEQKREMKLNLGPAKGKDFGMSIGPYVVTREELQWYADRKGNFDIEVRGYVNGKQYSSSNLRTMYWSFGDMIERASNEVTLRRGDIIMSGTVGTGCVLELGADKYGWLNRGDRVTFESEVLGKLENIVV